MDILVFLVFNQLLFIFHKPLKALEPFIFLHLCFVPYRLESTGHLLSVPKIDLLFPRQNRHHGFPQFKNLFGIPFFCIETVFTKSKGFIQIL